MATKLRAIREEDLELIMEWRMDPDITRYMNTDPILTIEKQKQWLKMIQENENCQYWLIEENEIPAGIISIVDIDWKEKNCSWGYYIGNSKVRSLKLALSLEMSLYDYVFFKLQLNELHNEVFSLNKGVIKLHLSCGSHISYDQKGEIVKNNVEYDITHISIQKEQWEAIRDNKKYNHISFDHHSLGND